MASKSTPPRIGRVLSASLCVDSCANAHSLLGTRLNSAAMNGVVCRGEVSPHLNVVAQTKRNGIHPQLSRRSLNQQLAPQYNLRISITAHGSCHGLIGVNGIPLKRIISRVILKFPARRRHDSGAVCRIRARIVIRFYLNGANGAIVHKPHFHMGFAGMARGGCQHLIFPRVDDFYRTPHLPG